MMRLSFDGLMALLAHEGIVPGPYRDSVGVWTYGIGHTAKAGAPDPQKMPRGMPDDLDAELREVFAVFDRDIRRYEADVQAAVRVPLEQHEFDALVSFHYNTGAIARASFVKSLNAGRKDEAAAQMMNWRRPPEIIPRREAEQRLFRDGLYPSGTVIPVWRVTDAGGVVWQPVRRLTADDVREALGLADEAETPPSAPPAVEVPEPGLWAAIVALLRRIFGA